MTLLTDLANIENGGVGFPVGLIVGGHVINGNLGNASQFASELDRTLQIALEETQIWRSGRGVEPDSAREDRIRAGISFALREHSFSSVAETNQRQLAEMTAEIESLINEGTLDVEEPPSNLVEQLSQYLTGRVSITIIDSSIHMPGLGWEEIGVMRVRVDQISAWWPLGQESSKEDAPQIL